MDKNVKKYRRSPFAIACYVIAAVLLVYICYLIGSTINTINEYYAQYGMSAQPMEYVTYTMQTILEPLVNAIVIFMLGYILDEVRKNNPKYYLSDEEILEASIAKKEAKEAKKFAAGEKAAAKAGNEPSPENSVEADFAKSLDEELKADEKKSEYKRSNNNNRGAKKQGSNRSNANKNNRGGNENKGNGETKGAGEGKSNNAESKGTGEGKSRNSGQRRNNNRKSAADKEKKAESKAEKSTEPKAEENTEPKDGE